MTKINSKFQTSRKTMIFVFFLFCSTLNAEVISINSILSTNQYTLSYNNNDGDGTALFVNINQVGDIEPFNYTLGAPFAWYSIIDPYNFYRDINSLIPFAANWGMLSTICIEKNQPFYLGSWSGNNYDMVSQKPIVTMYDTLLVGRFVVDSNKSLNLMDSTKIVIIPEPSCFLLVIMGISILIYMRNSWRYAINDWKIKT